MKSLRIFDGHLRYAVLAVTLVIAAVVPAFASAAQLTERSAALSSSSKGATGVNYDIKFTATTNAGAAVVQFCSNSPLIGEFCDTPTGFTAANATAGTGVTSVDDKTASTVKITKAAGTQEFVIGGITNPAAAGTIYARILTYADSTAAQSYVVSDSASALGSPIDQGSVAISITDSVNVSGSVRESLVFCVSGEKADDHTNPITASCGGTLVTPTLNIGEEIDGTYALDASHLSTADVYTQLSTNAIGGAVVSLRSSTAGCGGLALNGTGACNILPAGSTGTFAAGTAKFGLKTGANDVDVQNGTIQAAGVYDDTNYRFNWVNGDGSGVTGPYGDPILNTDSKPASNKDMKLTFGASAANNTAAGKYSADISLIATGTF